MASAIYSTPKGHALSMPSIFDPITFAGLSLPSRFVRSATAEGFAMDTSNDAESLAALYADLARGGVGLIVAGHMAVSARGRHRLSMAGIFTDAQRRHWAVVAAATHAAGGVVAAQINHCGGRGLPEVVGTPLCVSSLPDREKDPMQGQEMTVADIEAVIIEFADAACAARDAGFDAVQIHAAHGYLGSQFLSPASNLRTDEWGGPLEGRARFLRRVVQAIRAAVGPAYPVGMKLGALDSAPAGLTLDDTVQAARWFEADGLGFIEISGAFHADVIRRRVRPGEGEGYYAAYAHRFREALTIPVIAVGGFRSVAAMNAALASGDCDAVALCRPFIRQPDLPHYLQTGHSVSECTSCNRCLMRRAGPLACQEMAASSVGMV
jgi:2,4-dienoyl-CoA reductase-like NADH-dependent reductase (Old Yellow Enzyme family)